MLFSVTWVRWWLGATVGEVQPVVAVLGSALCPLISRVRVCVVVCVCEGDVLFAKDCPSSCIVRWAAEEGRREEG